MISISILLRHNHIKLFLCTKIIWINTLVKIIIADDDNDTANNTTVK